MVLGVSGVHSHHAVQVYLVDIVSLNLLRLDLPITLIFVVVDHHIHKSVLVDVLLHLSLPLHIVEHIATGLTTSICLVHEFSQFFSSLGVVDTLGRLGAAACQVGRAETTLVQSSWHQKLLVFQVVCNVDKICVA